MNREASSAEGITLVPWDTARYVRSVPSEEVALSRGFLRSAPQKWFPGVGAQWLPLAHTLGIELRLSEVKTVLAPPRGLAHGFGGTIDGEPMAIFLDEQSAKLITEASIPRSSPAASSVITEYFARRLLSSLASSWSGPESSVVRFDPHLKPYEMPCAGAIRLTLRVNDQLCTIWFALGSKFVSRLDNLWRRQMQSTARGDASSSELHVEVAQLGVPPSMLMDYVRSKTVIDLEIPLSDVVVIRQDGKALSAGKMCESNGMLVVEMLQGPAVSPIVPDGMTRLSIEMGTFTLPSSELAELGQPGAYIATGLQLSDKVQMVINNEKVADATLCVYEGRFAITVS